MTQHTSTLKVSHLLPMIQLADLLNASMDPNIYSRCSLEFAFRFLTTEAGNFMCVPFLASIDFDYVVLVERSVSNSISRARFTVLNTRFLHLNMTFVPGGIR